MFEGVLLATAVAASSLSFSQAKALADLDEASLSATYSHRLVESQEKASNHAFSVCLPFRASEVLQSFTVVIELDAQGHVQQMWGQGETELARCVEGELAQAVYFHPPKVPFYASFDFIFQSQ